MMDLAASMLTIYHQLVFEMDGTSVACIMNPFMSGLGCM